MKKPYVILLFVLCMSNAYGQWKPTVGINVLPMSVKSFEVVSEFAPHPAFAFTLQAGRVFSTGYEGIADTKEYDGVSGRRTSGSFARIGGRVYFLSFSGRERRVNLFTGISLIGMKYHKTADKADLVGDEFPRNVEKVERSGYSWGPALQTGLTFRLSRNLFLDAGIQHSFLLGDHGYIGSRDRNYLPGFGSGQSIAFLPFIPPLGLLADNIQGIVALKYRF